MSESGTGLNLNVQFVTYRHSLCFAHPLEVPEALEGLLRRDARDQIRTDRSKHSWHFRLKKKCQFSLMVLILLDRNFDRLNSFKPYQWKYIENIFHGLSLYITRRTKGVQSDKDVLGADSVPIHVTDSQAFCWVFSPLGIVVLEFDQILLRQNHSITTAQKFECKEAWSIEASIIIFCKVTFKIKLKSYFHWRSLAQ